tara:strand:- start:6718 stop:7515 length:798 start_codon:yes stop_codon:yes gene_type:complete
MKFKLSFSLLALKNEKKIETLLKILNKEKIFHIEIPILKFFPNYNINDNKIKKLKKKLRKYQIKISSIQAIFYKKNLNILSNKDEEKVIKHLKKINLFCKKLEIKNIIFGSPLNRDRNNLSFKEADKNFVKILKKISVDLRKKKINFCIEPNSKFYKCNYINNTKQALNLLKKNKIKNIYINFDTGNALLEKDSVKINKTDQKYFKNFQVSEKNLSELKNHKKHIDLLNKLNLKNKYLSLEMLNIDLYKVKRNLQKFKLIAEKVK